MPLSLEPLKRYSQDESLLVLGIECHSINGWKNEINDGSQPQKISITATHQRQAKSAKCYQIWLSYVVNAT